jgi:hypothetical protein
MGIDPFLALLIPESDLRELNDREQVIYRALG